MMECQPCSLANCCVPAKMPACRLYGQFKSSMIATRRRLLDIRCILENVTPVRKNGAAYRMAATYPMSIRARLVQRGAMPVHLVSRWTALHSERHDARYRSLFPITFESPQHFLRAPHKPMVQNALFLLGPGIEPPLTPFGMYVTPSGGFRH